MEDRIDSGRCAGDVLAAGDLIFSGVAGCENCVADFAILPKILALDARNRSDDLCRGIGAPADWHDRFPGKLDLAAETGNGPRPLGRIVRILRFTWPFPSAAVRAFEDRQ